MAQELRWSITLRGESDPKFSDTCRSIVEGARRLAVNFARNKLTNEEWSRGFIVKVAESATDRVLEELEL